MEPNTTSRREWFDWFFMTYLNAKSNWTVQKSSNGTDDYYHYEATGTNAVGEGVTRRGTTEIEASSNDINHWTWDGVETNLSSGGVQWTSDSSCAVLLQATTVTMQIWESDIGTDGMMVKGKQAGTGDQHGTNLYLFSPPFEDTYQANVNPLDAGSFPMGLFLDVMYYRTSWTTSAQTVYNHTWYTPSITIGAKVVNKYSIGASTNREIYAEGYGGDILTRYETSETTTVYVKDDRSDCSSVLLNGTYYWNLDGSSGIGLMLDCGNTDPELATV